MAQILCFGDSITYGMWDEQGGWVTRLRHQIDREIIKSKYLLWHEVFNLGVSGDLSSDLLKRVRVELPSRLLVEPAGLSLVQVGINDTKQYQSSTESTPAKYQSNLKKLHQAISRYTKKIVFLGLTAADEDLYGGQRWADGKGAYLNSRIQEFDGVLLEFCKENRLDYVPLFYEFYKDVKGLLADGIHPNGRGHQKIFELVWPVVRQHLDRPG